MEDGDQRVVGRDEVFRELLTLDFKARASAERFELAKDVAAFANASGGTILFGADEDRATATLRAYVPLDEREAAKTERDVTEAVRDRCNPRPVIACASIPYGSGVVLAVNVWPFIGQAVGVRVRADRGDGYGGNAYVFPLRVGTHTPDLEPGQIAMLMLPSLRRITILLSQITPRSQVTFQFNLPSHQSVRAAYVFLGVHPLQNRVEVADRDTPQTPLSLPLDGVESVWLDARGWTLLVNGRFDEHDGVTRWMNIVR
ncbi:MAG TPA: ATP-binding protein [Polyangiaceae bacterium]|nr:ATP-binding protein [Polyangiaceae bacterium]